MFLKVRGLVLLAVMANLLVACGGGDEGGAPAGPNNGHDTGIRSTSPEAAYRVIKNRPYIISDLAQIPEPSALLMFTVYDFEKKTYNAHQCSSSLIAPDVILTNSHCIPDQIKYRNPKKKSGLKKNYSCKSWIVAHFPDNSRTRTLSNGKTQYDSSNVDCEKVIFASNNDAEPVLKGFDFNQDYAIIKLSKPVTDREVLVPEFDGIEANQKLFTLSYDPIQGGGEFKKKECKAIEKSVLLKMSEYPITQNILMADCTVIKGNSGSPVVDENNVLRGALWGGPGNPEKLKQDYNQPEMTEFTYVTSVSCMNVPGYIVAPPHMNCDLPVNGLAGVGEEDVFQRDYEGSLIDSTSNYPLASFFGYTAEYQKIPVVGSTVPHEKKISVPACVKDIQALDQYINTPGERRMAGEFSLTIFDMVEKFNRYLQPFYQIAPSSQFNMIYYEISKYLDVDNGNEPVFKLDLKYKSNQRLFNSYHLKACQ